MYLALALLMLVAIACGSPEPVEPTPDVPLFAEGEAEAIVWTHIIERKIGIGSQSETLRSRLQLCLDARGSQLRAFGNGSTTSQYLGNRLWSVTAEVVEESFDQSLAWEVFETSFTVTPSNTTTALYHRLC